MNRHAKAAPADSNRGHGIRRGLFGAACLCALGLAALLGSGAPSAGADPACPNEAIRAEQHSTALPDCRAYEMVSPPDKNGADVMIDTRRVHAAADGNGIVFPSLTGFGDAQGTGIATDYLAQRDANPATDGWSTHGITPPLDTLTLGDLILSTAGVDPLYVGDLSPDLSKGVFFSSTPLPGTEPNAQQALNLYLRTGITSPSPSGFQLLTACTACAAPLSRDVAHPPLLAGASADFSHVIFEAIPNLTQDAVDAGLDPTVGKLYEWVDGPGGGSLRLAGLVPSSGTECGGGGPACVPAPNSAAGQGALERRYTTNTISADGSRVFFTAPLNPDHAGQLYLRDDQGTASSADDTTTQIDASENPSFSGPLSPAKFWAATPDGTEAFFTSPDQLTAAPGAGLYRYDAEAPAGERLTLLSVDDEPADGSSATTVATNGGVIGISDDGSYVYFAAAGQLVAGGQTGGVGDNAPRIYVWHDDGADPPTTRLVGKVGGELNSLLSPNWLATPKASRVTPDGRHIVFSSGGTDNLDQLAGVPGFDHGNSCPGLAGGACTEIYAYDASANGGAGQLACASCNPFGAPAQTNALFDVRASAGLSAATYHQNHPLSTDGRYVFFSSADALVPQDTNGRYDAYSYDTATGQIHLLSSGTDPADSYFLDASTDGRDAFFVSRDRLLGFDRDGSKDIYDARIGGGFPEPPPSAQCSGDTCQGAAAASPTATTPGSSGGPGPGNPKPARKCKKGFVRKNGRCVKQHHHSHRKRSHKSRTANTKRGGNR